MKIEGFDVPVSYDYRLKLLFCHKKRVNEQAQYLAKNAFFWKIYLVSRFNLSKSFNYATRLVS